MSTKQQDNVHRTRDESSKTTSWSLAPPRPQEITVIRHANPGASRNHYTSIHIVLPQLPLLMAWRGHNAETTLHRVQLCARISHLETMRHHVLTESDACLVMTSRKTASYVHDASNDTLSFVTACILQSESSSGNGRDFHRGAPGTGPRNDPSHASTSSILLSTSSSGDKDGVTGRLCTTTVRGKLFIGISGHGLGRYASSSLPVSVSVAPHTGLQAIRSKTVDAAVSGRALEVSIQRPTR